MAEVGFKVPGMTDGHSVKTVTNEIRKIDGVRGVEIDLYTKWVVVTGPRIDTNAIRRAVARAGYGADV